MAFRAVNYLKDLDVSGPDAFYIALERIDADDKKNWAYNDYPLAIETCRRLQKQLAPNFAMPALLSSSDATNLNTLLQAAATEYAIHKARSHKNSTGLGRAHLTPQEKSKCREALAEISDIISKSKLTAAKKNSIAVRLAAAASEIEKDITQTDTIMGTMGDLILSSEDLLDSAKPAINKARQLINIVLGRTAQEMGQPPPAIMADDVPLKIASKE